jgi:hypothetical protein
MALINRLPPIDARLLTTAVVAGAFATIGFDLFGQFVSPLLKGTLGPFIGAKLAPVPLANQSIAVLTGLDGSVVSGRGLGHGLHVLTGLVLYPLGYVLVVRPLAPQAPWALVGAAYGAALFVFALYVMAHLVAGNPAFLGWGGITWVALWGHVLFGVIVAGVVRLRGEAQPVARPEPRLA